jgi:hypothetical protein
MTLEEVKTILEGIEGFEDKVTYYAWPVNEAPALPFLCYVENRAQNFGADNKVYYSAREIAVELYTETKSPEDEALVEAALTAEDIFWTKEEEYLDDEQCWMITYTIGV